MMAGGIGKIPLTFIRLSHFPHLLFSSAPSPNLSSSSSPSFTASHHPTLPAFGVLPINTWPLSATQHPSSSLAQLPHTPLLLKLGRGVSASVCTLSIRPKLRSILFGIVSVHLLFFEWNQTNKSSSSHPSPDSPPSVPYIKRHVPLTIQNVDLNGVEK